MRKWWMFGLMVLVLTVPILADAQLDRALEGLFGRREEGVTIEDLIVTQIEMFPDPVGDGQKVSFRAMITNNSPHHTRLALAVMDRDRVASQVNEAYLQSGNNVITFPDTGYQLYGRDQRCFTIGTNINRRLVRIPATADFCAKRSYAGWSMHDRGIGPLYVDDLLMFPDPVMPGQEIRFTVRLRNDGGPLRGDLRIQDRDQIVAQINNVAIPRGLSDLQIPRSRYTFQRMDTCFTVKVDIDRTPYEVDASREYCANPTAWSLKARLRDRRDERDRGR